VLPEPDIRFVAGAGRKRKGILMEYQGDKQTCIFRIADAAE